MSAGGGAVPPEDMASLPGEYVKVKITEAKGHTLRGERV